MVCLQKKNFFLFPVISSKMSSEMSSETSLEIYKTEIKTILCDLPDHKKEMLTFGYIRLKATTHKFYLEIPLDVFHIIIKYQWIDYKKTNISAVIIGGHNNGKSTLCSRLLYDIGIKNDDDLDKAKQKRLKSRPNPLWYFVHEPKEDFLADLFHIHPREISMRYTIDYHINYTYSRLYHYTLIDTPGIRNYIKNMIYGASQADIAILAISAIKFEFEHAICKGNYSKGEMEGVCRQQLRILHLLGIKQLIICINKIDKIAIESSEIWFNKMKQRLSKLLTKIGYKVKKIPFIPINAHQGDNVTVGMNGISWYTGWNIKIKKQSVTGYTLLDAMDVMQIPKGEREIHKPFRFTISKIWTMKTIGRVLFGRIDQGQINSDDKIKILPYNIYGRVKSIHINHKLVKHAIAGDQIGIVLDQVDHFWCNKEVQGGVMCLLRDQSLKGAVKLFVAHIFVRKHPGRLYAAKWTHKVQRFNKYEWRLSSGYKYGYTPVIYVRNNRSTAMIRNIIWKCGVSTNNLKVFNGEYVEMGDEAVVEFEVIKDNMMITTFDDCQIFGRVIIMDHNCVVMIGRVIEIKEYYPVNVNRNKGVGLNKVEQTNVWLDEYVSVLRLSVIYGESGIKVLKIERDKWRENKNNICMLNGLLEMMYLKVPFFKRDWCKGNLAVIISNEKNVWFRQVNNDRDWFECVVKGLESGGVCNVKIVNTNHKFSLQMY
eukprot:506456_1